MYRCDPADNIILAIFTCLPTKFSFLVVEKEKKKEEKSKKNMD
jgi:hypothetical protein